jgi:DNA primase
MAGLIPQPFIDDLLARVDIVDVVESRIKLRKTGKNYSGLCPFHNEKSPSFTVEPDKQFYYCFGCGAGGNAIGFVMNYENLDFPEAIESIAHGMGLEVPRESVGSAAAQQQRKAVQENLYDILKSAATWYQRQLRTHPERQRAVDYLKGRQLSGEIARDFGLGFAPPGWDNLLQALGETDHRKQLLVEAGLLIEAADNPRRPLYDRFRDRIIYPIRDRRGRVIGFGGRVLGDDKPKYLNSPETEVFHKGRELYGLYEARRKLRKFDRVLIVEGYMDVIALFQHDIHNAVATLGTATSASHLQTSSN